MTKYMSSNTNHNAVAESDEERGANEHATPGELDNWQQRFQQKFPLFRLWEKYALRDLVGFIQSEIDKAYEQGQHDTIIWNEKEVYDKAREEGRQEGRKEQFAEEWPKRGKLAESIRQEERSRILKLIPEIEALLQAVEDGLGEQTWRMKWEALKRRIQQ